jgi:hypothetical protein
LTVFIDAEGLPELARFMEISPKIATRAARIDRYAPDGGDRGPAGTNISVPVFAAARGVYTRDATAR